MKTILALVMLSVSITGCADGYYMTSGGYQNGYYNNPYGQYPRQYGYGNGYPRQGQGYGYYYQSPPVYAPPVPTLQFNWGHRGGYNNGWNQHEWREHHGWGGHHGRDRD